MAQLPVRPLLVIILVSILAVCLLTAATNLHQSRTVYFGSSGGNINNISNRFCCSGTLGALVQAGTNRYILSNNHILADVDQAAAGEDISQPGLIDNNCRPGTIVADFTAAPALGSNVDAALALLRTGTVSSPTMDSAGYILDLGTNGAGPPNTQVLDSQSALNQTVAKSGRTTGLTCGPVQSINTTIKVQYQTGCNKGKKFTVTYTNQVVISSTSFSAGGDSGSLIVSESGTMPVALLYAGSSTTTIGNPIGEVLTKVGQVLNPPAMVTFVGANSPGDVTCPSSGGGGSGKPRSRQAPSLGELDHAKFVKDRHAQAVMADMAVMGVGVGANEQNPLEAVIVIYVERGRSHAPIPAELEGVRTQVVVTDLIRAYGWNREKFPEKACSAR
ncbi:MAG: hypothetical protein ACE14M_05365 [Terriglobales bacterium]